jgi:hypothetical protein
MIGSSSPATISAGWRSRGRNGRLVQPTPARSWYRYPTDGPTRLPLFIVAAICSGMSRAEPP